MFWNYLYDESLIIYGNIYGVLLDMPFEDINKLKENNNGESVGVDFKVCFDILKSLQHHQKSLLMLRIFLLASVGESEMETGIQEVSGMLTLPMLLGCPLHRQPG